MKKIIVVLSICLLFLTGCHDTNRYYGKYPEYFSIAASSLLGISGSEFDTVEVLEQDMQGRILFSFSSPGISMQRGKDSGLYSVMICQKTDDTYSYFYPDYHFVVRNKDEEITEGEINSLKERNDWNREIDNSKMVHVKFTCKKDNIGGITGEDRDETKIFDGKVDDEKEQVQMIRLGIDGKKRSLYLASILIHGEKSYICERSYLVILNADYTYDSRICLQEVEDIWNYQDQLKAFKELNDWVPDLECLQIMDFLDHIFGIK